MFWQLVCHEDIRAGRRRDQQQRVMKIAGSIDHLAHFARLIGVIEKWIGVVRRVKPEQTRAQARAEQERRSGSAQTASRVRPEHRRFATRSRRSLPFP